MVKWIAKLLNRTSNSKKLRADEMMVQLHHVLHQGVSISATIMATDRLGFASGDLCEILISYSYHNSHDKPIQTCSRTLLSRHQFPRIGETVKLKFLPDNSTIVLIVSP